MAAEVTRRLGALLAGCVLGAPPAHAQTAVRFSLNYVAGGNAGGYAIALEAGLHKAEGLDVTIIEGKGSSTTAHILATGQYDVVAADASAVMQLRARGASIKVVASPLQMTGNAVMTLPDSAITSVAQLAGRRLGVEPGSSQAALITPILGANGLKPTDVTIVNMQGAALVRSLLARQVDAIAAGNFQTVQVAARAGGVNIMSCNDKGAPNVGVSIAAREERLRNEPNLFRRFVAASLEGGDRARRDPDPDAATAATARLFAFASTDSIGRQLRIELGFLCGRGATTLDRAPDAIWAPQWTLLTTYLGLPKVPPVSDCFDYAFIPADAPTCP